MYYFEYFLLVVKLLMYIEDELMSGTHIGLINYQYEIPENMHYYFCLLKYC